MKSQLTGETIRRRIGSNPRPSRNIISGHAPSGDCGSGWRASSRSRMYEFQRVFAEQGEQLGRRLIIG